MTIVRYTHAKIEHEKTNILNTLNTGILCVHKVTMPIPVK